MIDVRPVAYVVGWLMLMLGGLMALPMVVDIAAGHSDAVAFAVSADTEMGDYDEEPTILFKSGQLPPPFSDPD